MSKCIRQWLVVLGAGLALAACSQKPVAPTPAHLPQVTAEGAARAAALPAPFNAGDPFAGRDAFTPCAECHGFDDGASQEKGPVLTGFFGKRAATARPDYAYTEALRNSDFVWELRRLDQWLFNPRETLPGTSMSFIGVRNDKRRRDLLAYLVAVEAIPAAGR